MSRVCVKFLKEKTDAECRELAGHYYRRARGAEGTAEQLRQVNNHLESELARVRGLAQEYAEAIGEQGHE